ncbi:MAG: Gfo/Idh/MocA family oxidoreductase [Rhodospirillales bacterium]|nr:Gfo/Idh/MocA family oxidoreductase [Rhodospirillales bacterium]
MAHGVAFIGLGTMGQRMAGYMGRHAGFRVLVAWDPNPDQVRKFQTICPEARIAGSAAEAIRDDRIDSVYIACPPFHHKQHAETAIAAGKAVFCEKPLGVDIAESRKLVDLVERKGIKNAINFSHAGRASTRLVEQKIKSGEIGTVYGATILHDLPEWPADWQKGIAWLGCRDQGGFVRENLSHYIYLSRRLLGPPKIVFCRIDYPADGVGAETAIMAELDCGGVPVRILGSVGGKSTSKGEFILRGEQRSYRFHTWSMLDECVGDKWTDALPHIADTYADQFQRQLDDLADLIEGRASPIPGFRDALAVQEVIEEMLRV